MHGHKINVASNLSFVLIGLLLLSGCGADHRFKQAKAAEKKEKYQQAWELYQEFAAKYPKHPAAPEALFRAGWLAQRNLGDCTAAKAFYDSVIQRYPQSSPWATQAAYFKNNCPDFFPLLAGFKWVEGDSETHGKNARVEIICRSVGGNRKTEAGFAGMLEKTYFAGETKFKTIDLFYKKTDAELSEFASKSDPRFKTILMWPLQVETHWTTKMDGKTFHYEITSDNETISVQAGEFSGCLKVRSEIEGFPGATNEFYAPGVGRILVTISTKEGEKRNTELISYSPATKPRFETEEKAE